MLEVGQTYIIRSRHTVRIVSKDYADEFPFLGSNGAWYAPEGHVMKDPKIESEYDIVGKYNPLGAIEGRLDDLEKRMQIHDAGLVEMLNTLQIAFEPALEKASTEVREELEQNIAEMMKKCLN